MKRNDMKPENPKTRNKRRIYWTIAIICLIYGGITLLMFVFSLYFNHARTQFNPPPYISNISNVPSTYGMAKQAVIFRPMPHILPTIISILTFIGSLVSIGAGISLLKLVREKETKELKREVIDSMIMPDEKIVIRELEKNNGALTQSELVRNTALSKVKVHRIVKRLESLEIVKKYPYGITNKIKLEKFLEE